MKEREISFISFSTGFAQPETSKKQLINKILTKSKIDFFISYYKLELIIEQGKRINSYIRNI